MPTVDLPQEVTIYCCEACGKWSHAKQKPRFHRRTKSGYDRPDDEGLPVLEEDVSPYHEHDGVGLAHIDDVYTVTLRCGPFVTYRAERDYD